MKALILDIESCGLPDAADYAEPVQAPSNWRDEAKIKAYVEEKSAEQVSKAALDLDLGRVIAVGMSTGRDEAVRVLTATDDASEAALLIDVWSAVERDTTIIGFNIVQFDLPFLVRRSQYLDVPHPHITIDRYRTPHIDLMLRLTWNGLVRQRSLKFYAKRFGLPIDDTISGADIPALVAAGDLDAVRRHVTSDVRLTAALARRLGLLPALAPPREQDGELVF